MAFSWIRLQRQASEYIEPDRKLRCSVREMEQMRLPSMSSTRLADLQGDTMTQEVKVRFTWPGLEAEIVNLRLLPGLPRALRLLPGHPFREEMVTPGSCSMHCLRVWQYHRQ